MSMSNSFSSSVSHGSGRQYILTLSCSDRTGIVATIAGFLADIGGSIAEAAYYADELTGWFLTRQAINAETVDLTVDQIREQFAPVAESFGPDVEWKITDSGQLKRMVILVSKESHCLYDLLARIAQGDYPAEVACVIGNHESLAKVAEAHNIPFHFVPFPREPQGKKLAFDIVRELTDVHNPDVIVLARFMQIVPPDLCDHWAGRALNIHHSFLPSFMGARPYAQAFNRGVKLIGATCHFVTKELDNGPIIEQDVIRVDHSDTIGDMVRQGKDIEKLVLARGLRWHLEDRVLVHGLRTVVFK